jgi:hypothetical protein
MSRDDSRDGSWTAPVRFRGALRAAILEALAPYVADPATEAATLRELEELARSYLADLETLVNDREQVRGELRRLGEAADALSQALGTLSEETRDRLTDWVPYATTPGESSAWGPLVPSSTLARSSTDAVFIAARAEVLREEVERERPRVGRPRLLAERALVHGLADVWTRLTGQKPPRGDCEGKPWGEFVSAVFKAVGAEGNPYYVGRAVAERLHEAEKTVPE